MRVKDESKRLAIVEQTLEIVLNKGIAGLKMAGLAREVKLSPSTLYVYYKSKEDLIISMFSEIFNEQSSQMKFQMSLDLPYKLKLKKIWMQWLDLSVNNYKAMNFIKQVKQSPYIEKLPKELMKEKEGLSHFIFEEGKKEQLLKNIDNELLAATLHAMLSQSVILVMEGTLTMNDDDLDLWFSLIWDAIKS